MDARDLTRHVLIGAAVVLVLYNLAVLLLVGPRATISVVLSDDARRFPAIALAAGLILGHIFWPVWAD